MGLDAVVYCNCYETGKLREPPPRPELVSVEPNGMLVCKDGGDDALWFQLQNWIHSRACEHPDGELIRERIGNIAQVALLRAELQRQAASFPLILGKVIYSGSHGGDFLDLHTVKEMRGEIAHLAGFHSPNKKREPYLREFERQILELCEAALRVGKPIAF
jgi:hypothetical protein